jgi:hypothetical protein
MKTKSYPHSCIAQGASVLNYDIAAGNHDAARITSPGANFASTSPWADFSFQLLTEPCQAKRHSG